eukprot:Gb_14645 [translate_table: standard]
MWRQCKPVLNVRLPAPKSRCVYCECNRLKTSILCSSDKLCNHMPILVDIELKKADAWSRRGNLFNTRCSP